MNRPSNAALAFAALILLLVVALGIVLTRHPAAIGFTATPATAGQPSTAAALTPQPALAAAAAHPPGALPTSLEGTQPPGLRVDASGNLIIESALRDLFEYYLSALGEEDLEAVRSRLAAHLLATLSPAAAERAWQIFGDYLEYRAALADMPAVQLDSLESARTRLDAASTLRRAQLGNEVADAFFHNEEAYDRFTVDRLVLEKDAALSPDEKARQVAQLEAALPPELLAARRDSVAITEVGLSVEKMRRAGASEAEIRATREQALGTEAADRLAALDSEEAAWDARYADYTRERDAINAAAMSPADHERQVDALRKRLFSEQEAMRVDALDRIAAGTAK